MKTWLNPINNAPLIVFRIIFGFLLTAESFGAIATGWVKRVFIDSQFSFNHIGFNWLQIFHGQTMYFYFVIMGICGIGVMLGFKYRASMLLFSVLWTGSYLMQKEAYNNHYYLLMLISWLMCFLPANAYFAIDSKLNPKIKTYYMSKWISILMIIMVTFVYWFSVLAKCYPGWLNGSFVNIMFSNTHEFPVIGNLTKQKWFQYFIIYSGLFFDLLIVPLLLIKKTRTIAFIASIIFHVFNAVSLHIGIFPFFALSFILFFYEPETIQKTFFKKQLLVEKINYNPQKKVFYFVVIPFLVVQFMLPLRHYFIAQNVLWTEEGHRLSWRMMLRSRSGSAVFNVENLKTQKTEIYDYAKVLTEKQIEWFNNKPDGIWQMAQYIKQEYLKKGIKTGIYVDSFVTINGSKYYPLIDNKINLAEVKWNYFCYNPWILPTPKEFE